LRAGGFKGKIRWLPEPSSKFNQALSVAASQRRSWLFTNGLPFSQVSESAGEQEASKEKSVGYLNHPASSTRRFQ
jgi:hypothetical protein